MTTNKGNFCSYNKSLQPFANELRKEMTKAEVCLWKYVFRAGQMNGYKTNIQSVAGEIKKIIAEITSPGTPSRGGHKKSAMNRIAEQGVATPCFTTRDRVTIAKIVIANEVKQSHDLINI